MDKQISDGAQNGLVFLIALCIIAIGLLTILGIFYALYSVLTIYGGCFGEIKYSCMYVSDGPYGLPLETYVTCPAALNKVYNSDNNPPYIAGETRKYASCWMARELIKNGQIPVYKYFLIFKYKNGGD